MINNSVEKKSYICPYGSNGRKVIIKERINVTNNTLRTFEFEVLIGVKDFWRRKEDNLEVESIKVDFSKTYDPKLNLDRETVYKFADNICDYINKTLKVKAKNSGYEYITKAEYEFVQGELDRHMCHYHIVKNKFSNVDDIFKSCGHMFQSLDAVKKNIQKAY